MKLRVRTGEALSQVSMPDCQVVLGLGFLKALQCAATFIGPGSRWYPWTRYVYLTDGKLYASDNYCLVEVDLHDSTLGPARLSRQDIANIRKMGGSPKRVFITDHEIAFAWDHPRWASFDIEMIGIEFVSRCRALLEKFWHEGAPVTPEALKPSLPTWHPKAISKVSQFAKTFAPDSSPASFAFPGGRGLIASQSNQHTGPYQDGLFYHPGGTGIKELTRRVLSGEGFNPYLDDFLALAIKDTKDLLRANGIKKAAALRRELGTAVIDTEKTSLIGHLTRQHDVIAKYQRGEQLDQDERDVLRPRPDLLVTRLKRRRKKRGSNDDELAENASDNQEAKRDAMLVGMAREVVEERIESAFTPYFQESFIRNSRVQYWNRLGSLSARGRNDT